MPHVVVITGLSGSGKSTAKKCLEDLDYYTFENLPVPLAEEVLRLTLQSTEKPQNTAFVIDARIPEYLHLLPNLLQRLRAKAFTVDLIYLEASNEILIRRFSETRRKHPLSMGGSVREGLSRERDLLRRVRDQSTMIIDTSRFTIHELKSHLEQTVAEDLSKRKLAVLISSFGFRYGVPTDADLVFDVRFLANPYFDDNLRDLSGHDKVVQDYVMRSESALKFRQKLFEFVDFLLPHYQNEGKAYLHIAIGCTGGRHRSVTLVNLLGEHLREKLGQVRLEDRDLPRDERS